MKNLFSNALDLVSLSLLSRIVPLLLIPYLLIVLGDLFWVYGFGLTASFMIAILAEFGLNQSLSVDAAKSKDDSAKLSSYVQITCLIRGVAFALMLIPFAFWVDNTASLSPHGITIFAFLLGSLGEILTPIWLLVVLERTREIFIYYLSARILTLVGALVFVRDAGDLFLLGLCYGLPQLIVGVALLRSSLFIIGFEKQQLSLRQISDSAGKAFRFIFVQSSSSFLFSLAFFLFASGHASAESKSVMSLLERIYTVIKSVNYNFGLALLPKSSALPTYAQRLSLMRGLPLAVISFSCFVSLLSYWSMNTGLNGLLDAGFAGLLAEWKPIAFVPMITTISSVLLFGLLLPSNVEGQLSVLVGVVLIFFLALLTANMPLTSRFIAFGLVCSETFLAVSLSILCFRLYLNRIPT